MESIGRAFAVNKRRVAKRARARDPDMEDGLKKMMAIAAIGALAIVVGIAIADRYREETGVVSASTERFWWDTYEEAHTIYYPCGDDDTCSNTIYTTEWEYHVEYVITVNGKTFTWARTWQSGVTGNGVMPYATVPHFVAGDTVTVDYFDFGSYSVTDIHVHPQK